jgi:anti-sigma regulatory factor (Ser/Thr protein kinase)
MTASVEQPLNFIDVDGLAFAHERGRLSAGTPRKSFCARDLGPMLELLQLAAPKSDLSTHASRYITLGVFEAFCTALSSPQAHWVSQQDRRSGFHRTREKVPGDDISWVAFRLAAQQAAVECGFHRKVAAQLIGALGEMHSNIYEHSEAPATGLIAFNATPGSFEFVIADRGIGVLRSLRTARQYADLADHGSALQLVLRDGVSRHGSGTGRGYGFRPLFIGLANLNGHLRFRSGDYALTIDGNNPTLMSHKLSQKPAIAGFFASIACYLDSSKAARLTP